MNIKDIEQYITLQEPRNYYHLLPKDHEIVKDAIAFENDPENGNRSADKYIQDKYGARYRTWGTSRQNGKCVDVDIKDANYMGIFVRVEYRGFTFPMMCEADGTVDIVHFVFDYWQSSSNWQKLCTKPNGTLDDIHTLAMKMIAESKRKMMNYYNKLIKDTKADYREKLDVVNALLKDAAK